MDDGSGCLERGGEFVNPVLTMGAQLSCLLVISHFFQLLLKPLGQPAPLAQILAGFVLGPSCLSHIESVRTFFFYNSTDYYETMALYARIVIMYIIGLEMDFPYLMRHLRVATVIACGSSVICTVFAIAVTSFIFEETGAEGSGAMMTLTLAIILCNTASPFVTCLAHDLRFAHSDLGRLAISSSLVADAYAVFLLIIVSTNKREFGFSDWLVRGVLCLVIVVTAIYLNIYLADWLNSRHRHLKYLKNTELFAVISVLFVAATSIETMGISSILACFLLGALFPRGGKVGRTLLIKLSYAVHNFVLPFYFGYSGFKADLTHVNSFRNFAVVAIVILLSIGGKVTGTLAACFHLKIPMSEGVLLAFLMNLKGHVDLLALTIGVEDNVMSSQLFFNLMTAAVVINSLIWGPLIAYTVRRENDILGYKHVDFEVHCPEKELKLLACVHNPRPVATMVGLIATCKGSDGVAISPYLMHLIELPEKNKTKNLQKVLLHAKCTIAILIDRGLTAGSMNTSDASGCLHHIAMLFFGGHDDREALGLSKRLGMHHRISLTVIRFLHKSVPTEHVGINVDHKEEDVLMAIPSHESEADADNMILTDFFNRFVTSGQAGYVMKHVENGEETATALRDMADMYTLFIVGKGSRCNSSLTTGLSDWEECPELGRVGDFLASPDFELCGSVLVVQQYRPAGADEDQ